MENMTRILTLVLKRIPAQSVLTGKISGSVFDRTAFVSAMSVYEKNYSEDELSNMWLYFKERFKNNRVYFSRSEELSSDGINVFDVLFTYIPEMLVLQNNEIRCQYDRLLNWRMVTFNISEDLLVSAYYAQCKTPNEMEQMGFVWKTVIGHNNTALHHILHKGISENHFHLYGSAPMFHLSWINMMNNVLDHRVTDSLRRYDLDRRYSNVRFNENYEESSLIVQYYQAALIRVFLYSHVTGTEIQMDCGTAEKVLKDEYLLREHLFDIQSLINALRLNCPYTTGEEQVLQDYALLGVKPRYGQETDLFEGERWFLYSCLYKIYHGQMDETYENLFYAYCLIKEGIRSEIIQSNENVGFANFNKYQSRKWELLDGTFGNDDMVKSAVRKSVLDRHIRSLEIRISPRNTARGNVSMIQNLDTIIGEPRKKYFYVVHFIKSRDCTEYSDGRLHCRHQKKRRQIRKQTDALIAMRERYPRCAARILGIDAASSEIGCRPEVFASEFRRLKNHVKVLEYSSKGRKIPQLRITYHVGEDFLDLADGLRAIDEAVNFLNMDCGDRLGHALALGVDVEEWYQSKNNRILISKQDYLDNIAWLYNRLVAFRVPDVDSLKDYLRKKYELYFDQVYARYMDYGLIDLILNQAREQYSRTNIAHAFHNDRYRFDIFQYYNAWKLRGDDPELYVHGYFRWDDEDVSETSCRVNFKFPSDFGIRYRPEIFLIHYYYLYDANVRREGDQRIEVKIDSAYIRGVKLLQKEMQKSIGRRGIAIETNPSSNYLIGTFKDYAKHPIVNFYNRELTCDPEKLAACPQLSVSINTDDQGIFSTSLENEYALMASALEKIADENGNYMYNRSMVYAWINAVRKMGNAQSFLTDKKEYKKLLNDHL